MARASGLQKWLERAKAHPIVTVWLAVVGFFGGTVIILQGYKAIDEARTAAPTPELVQIETVPVDSEAYLPGTLRWVVTLENPADRTMSVVRADYEVSQFSTTLDLGAEYANATSVNISRNLYRLPLNCGSGAGSQPIVPPFPVPPKGSASFVIESDEHRTHCYFKVSFGTTQGNTEPMVAVPVSERQVQDAAAR